MRHSSSGGGKTGQLTSADSHSVVLASDGPALETKVSSLSIGMRTTTQNVSDVAAPLPAVAYADRRTFSVQNLSASDTLFIGTDNTVTADRVIGITSGWEIGPLETFNTNIAPGIVVYGIAAAGKTVQVKVLEIA